MPSDPAALPAVFFCLRADSDVDQIVPVIDGLARRGNTAIRVIVFDPVKTYRDDYRIRYLQDEYGIEVEHLLELPGIAGHRRRTVPLVRGLFHALLELQRRMPAILGRPLQLLLGRLREHLHVMSKSAECADALNAEIAQAPTGMVIFDHTKHPLARAVTAAARRSGIPTMALPHSVSHLSNLQPDKLPDPNADGDEGWSALYDHVALPNEALAARAAKKYRDPSFLTVLGSARFSRDWGEVLDRIVPAFDWRPGGTKVLFILSKKGPYVDWDEVNRITLRLSRDPRVALAIKPHPRTEISGIPKFAAGPQVRLAPSELPTASLIHWADLVVFWGSSVIYESLRLRKPTLHLAYLFRLNFDFETDMKSWTVQSYEDFEARLENFLASGGATYSEAEAGSCMENLVEQKGASTIQRYVDFILEHLGRPQDATAAEPPSGNQPPAERRVGTF